MTGHLRATVDFVEPRGHDHVLHLQLDRPGIQPFLAIVAGTAPPPAGADVFLTLPADDRLHLFDGRDGTRLT